MFSNIKEKNHRILVTGGAGFIGSCLITKLLQNKNSIVFNLDKISYASDFEQIEKCNNLNNYNFIKADLSNYEETKNAVYESNPDIIFHLAAESHVDRSIENSRPFIESNVIGTYNLLEISKNFWYNLENIKKERFRFIHVSTDEVFGSLGKYGKFSEESPYDPRSPYSASKAASDHFANAWFHTYDFPVIRTNCSNNFGPYQFPEKLIPLTISKALNNQYIPIYGDGKNVRDWLFVEDHADALIVTATKGKVGRNYCIGGNNEKTNLEIVTTICNLLDNKKPIKNSYKNLIRFVKDRPGHDLRYAINSQLIKNELKWESKYEFQKALSYTVEWYLKNQQWCNKISKNKLLEDDVKKK